MFLFEVIASVVPFYMSIYIIYDIDIPMKRYISNVFVTFIIFAIAALINTNYSLPAYAVTATVFLYHNYKNIKRTIFMVGVSIIVNMIAVYLCTCIQYVIWRDFIIEYNSIMKIVFYLIIILMVYITSKLLHWALNLKKLDFSIKSTGLIYTTVVITIFIGITIYAVMVRDNVVSKQTVFAYSIFIVITAIIMIGMIGANIRTAYKERELILKNAELNTLQDYVSTTESYYNEMRKFKHDYINIISIMAGYVEERDIDALEKYFENNIVNITEKFENEVTKFYVLEKIKVVELKGLVKVKLLQALGKNIDVSIEIIEEINSINWDIVKLCRTIGILLDNAIEAVENAEKKYINMAIFKKNNAVDIIIQNSFKGEKLSLQQVYKNGFSSKGEGRGMGLHIVKEFVDRSNNVSIETSIETDVFTQIIEIND